MFASSGQVVVRNPVTSESVQADSAGDEREKEREEEVAGYARLDAALISDRTRDWNPQCGTRARLGHRF